MKPTVMIANQIRKALPPLVASIVTAGPKGVSVDPEVAIKLGTPIGNVLTNDARLKVARIWVQMSCTPLRRSLKSGGLACCKYCMELETSGNSNFLRLI